MGIKADKGAGFGVGYVDVRNLTLSVDFNGGTVFFSLTITLAGSIGGRRLFGKRNWTGDGRGWK